MKSSLRTGRNRRGNCSVGCLQFPGSSQGHGSYIPPPPAAAALVNEKLSCEWLAGEPVIKLLAALCQINSPEEVAFESSSENCVLRFLMDGLHWGRVEVGASCSKQLLAFAFTRTISKRTYSHSSASNQ